MSMRWYIVHAYSNFEKKVAESIREQAKQRGLSELFDEVLVPKEKVTDLLDRRLITGDRMMLAHVYLKKGCVVPKHQHENEQLTYILSGALHFWIGVYTCASKSFFAAASAVLSSV